MANKVTRVCLEKLRVAIRRSPTSWLLCRHGSEHPQFSLMFGPGPQKPFCTRRPFHAADLAAVALWAKGRRGRALGWTFSRAEGFATSLAGSSSSSSCVISETFSNSESLKSAFSQTKDGSEYHSQPPARCGPGDLTTGNSQRLAVSEIESLPQQRLCFPGSALSLVHGCEALKYWCFPCCDSVHSSSLLVTHNGRVPAVFDMTRQLQIHVFLGGSFFENQHTKTGLNTERNSDDKKRM